MPVTLPPLFLEHYRAPRHEGALADPSAVGEVDGRREGARISLFLKVDAAGEVAASYACRGDRSPVASLSLLTTLIQGWTVARLEAFSLRQMTEAYGLPASWESCFLLAEEALRAALANLQGRPSPYAEEGPVVCHCLYVRRGRLERVIRERGARTVEELRSWTQACTGCRTCGPDLEGLLKACVAEDGSLRT